MDDPGYFKDHFLVLKNHSKFSTTVQKTYKKISRELRISNPPPLFRTSQLRNIIIKNLAVYQHRPGLIFQQIILDKLKQNSNSYYSCMELEHIGEGLREITKESINSNFISTRTVDLIKGHFYSRNKHKLPVPATIIAKLPLRKEEFAIEYMKGILCPALSNHSPELSSMIEETYLHLVDAYNKWIPHRNNRTTKEDLSSRYTTFLELFNEFLDQDKTLLKEYFDSEDLKLLLQTQNELEKSNYEGKGFPIFPGALKLDSINTLPPTKNNPSQFIFPPIGLGWQIERNSLKNLFLCHNLLSKAKEKLKGKVPTNLTNIIIQLNVFFNMLGIRTTILTSDKYNKLITLLGKKGDPKKLYEKVLSLVKDNPTYELYDCSTTKESEKIRLRIYPKENLKIENQRVLLLINDFKDDDSSLPWQYEEKNILPDIITTMFVNGGIWPKKIELFLKKTDFQMYQDKRWQKNNSLLRWFKATIDGIILKLLLNNEVNIKFKEDKSKNLEKCFTQFGNSDHFLIIPILLRSEKNTQTHSYYYDIYETINDLCNLELHIRTKGDYYRSKKEYENDSSLFTAFDRIIAHSHPDNLGNRINVQHFNFIPSINIEYATTWLSLANSLKDDVISQFALEGYPFSRSLGYKFDLNGIIQDIYLIGYSTKYRGNEKIFPDLFFGEKVVNVGATKEIRLGDILAEINENSSLQTSLQSFFENPLLKRSIAAFPGSLLKIDDKNIRLLPKLLVTANSLRRTTGALVDFKQVDKKGNEIPKDLRIKKFYTFHLEGYSLYSQTQDPENLFRIIITLYEKEKGAKIVFDEYFYASNDKMDSYREQILKYIFQVLYSQNIPILISIKNMRKTGKELKEIRDDLKEWGEMKVFTSSYFGGMEDYIKKRIEKGKKITLPHLWAYIKNFVPVSQLYLEDSNPRVFEFELETSFPKDLLEESFDDYKLHLNLILKGSPRSDLTKLSESKPERAEEELKSQDFYAHANALISFQKPGVTIPPEFKEEILDLQLFGSSIGDEKGELGLTGFERLFRFPHPDTGRRIFCPALLLRGVDFIVYKSRIYD